MVVVHQGVLSGPWSGEMVYQVWLLAVSLATAAVVVVVDCMFVAHVCQ